MKTFRLLLIVLLIQTYSQAQITISSVDLPSAGDTARLTVSQAPLGLNYQATGPNHSWDFSNLRNQSQEVDQFLNVSTTNFVYALYFANLPFNTNRANIATPGTPFPANPIINITNPYNFYYKSASSYKQVGLGAEFQGIPLPVAFSQKDVVYNFPLNFGNQDTSASAWNIALAGTIYYGYNQTRTNNADGWGTLITPRGTYNALRVKTTIIGHDTISLDSLGLNLNIDRPISREYKWLVNGEIVPELQITTTEIFGFEVVSAIRFRDDYLTIFPGVQPLAFCAGSTYTLPYTRQGTFNVGNVFQSGNTFNAFLSDANGDFTNAINIGSVTSAQSGTITVTIPANTPAGTGYRVRFSGTSPAVTGPDNGIDIEIFNGVPAASMISSVGNTQFCLGDSVQLNGTAVSAVAYNWELNGSSIIGATTTTFSATTAGDYTLVTSNICGGNSSNIITITVDSLPEVSVITANGNIDFCTGDSVQLTGSVVNNVTYQWTESGNALTGNTSTDLYVLQAGIYELQTINNCGVSISNAISATEISLATASVITANDTTLCFGDSTQLIGSPIIGVNYQWTLGGNSIFGAVNNSIYANQSGVYNLNSYNQCGTALSNDVSIIIYPPLSVPTITQNGLILTTVGGYSYSWTYNQTPIAVNDSVIPVTGNGDYQVVITDQNGCSITSAIFTVTNVGISAIEGNNIASVFPNPTSGEFTLQLKKTASTTKIAIHEISGKLLWSDTLIAGSFTQKYNFHYAAGIYFIEVMSGNEFQTFKLVIQ